MLRQKVCTKNLDTGSFLHIFGKFSSPKVDVKPLIFNSSNQRQKNESRFEANFEGNP